MTRIFRWLNTPFGLIIQISIWSTVDLIILGRSFSLDAGQWASWVQAIGSIAAILGAVWAAVHATSNANKAREEDVREASVSHVIFTRALLQQAINIISFIESSLAADQFEDLRNRINELSTILGTVKSLITQSRDAELTKVLVRAYEPMAYCHSQAQATRQRATDVAFAEFAASSAVRALESLRADLKSIATRLNAPAEPAGPEADFEVLNDDEQAAV
jgi:hypothetical protein